MEINSVHNFRSAHDYDKALEATKHTHAEIVFRPYRNPFVARFYIRDIVEKYEHRVLNDYVNLGILVRFNSGRAQIGPALQRKNPSVRSEYYYAPSDRRNNKGWVTVSRDDHGLRSEIGMFERLIDAGATETEMHKFFVENPLFLMQARQQIPISHSPSFSEPKGWTPDFVFSPILGPQGSQAVELLEMKGPGDSILSRCAHPGFSAKVHRAINQVRDYERCLRDERNHTSILEALGFMPRRSKLAVLIGRKPRKAEAAVFARRQSEIDVEIVTYDEILQAQVSQLI